MDNYNKIKTAIINDRMDKVSKFRYITNLLHGFNINKIDGDGYTLLHHACENQHNDIVKLLLDNDADPNIGDKSFNLTPLHWATEYEDEDMIKLLIYKGADPELPDIHGDKPNNNELTKMIHEEYLSDISKLLKSEQKLALAKTDDIEVDLIETISKLITSPSKIELIHRFIKQADENQHSNIIKIYKERLNKANNISNPQESEKERIKIVGQFINYIHRKNRKGSNKKTNKKKKKEKTNKKKKKEKKTNKKKKKEKKKKSKSHVKRIQ
jgi:ankyrin repeat protein